MKNFFNVLKVFLLVSVSMIAFASCTNNEGEDIKSYSVNVSITLPEGVELSDISDLEVVGVGSSVSDFTVDMDGALSKDVTLVAGSYKFTVTGKVTETTFVVGTANVDVYGEDVVANVILVSQTQSSLIIKSIHHASVAGYYITDCAVEILNNSDEVQYLDQLMLAANTACNQTSANAWQANGYENLYSTGQAPVLAFPGSGQDYPLEPGASVWVVNTGIDHGDADNVRPDQSNADFELYNPEASGGDTDIASVTNMEIIFANNSGTKGWGFGVNGGAWMLARCPEGVTPSEYAADAANSMTTPGTTSESLYLIFNTVNILDAVFVVPSSNTTPYCYFLTQDDAAPATAATSWSGLGLRRKTEVVDGATKYVDTNNSANDFETDVDLFNLF